MNNLTGEEKFWENFKKGDLDALKALYDHYINDLHAYGMILSPDTDKVKDCIHDLFLALWDSRHNFSVPNSGKAYLMVSLRRRIFDKGSKMDSLIQSTENLEAGKIYLVDHQSTWIEQEDAEKQNQQLERAMNRLTDRQKEIIHMKYFQELDYEEIGRIMDLNYQSARNLVNRAIAALRKEMLGVVMLLLIFI